MINNDTQLPQTEENDTLSNNATSAIRPVAALGKWVIRLTKFEICCVVINLFGLLYTYDYVKKWNARELNYRGFDWATSSEAYESIQLLICASYIIAVCVSLVAFLVWIYRCSQNAQVFDPNTARITPGWAVGWNFIPIAHFWKPYIAVRETWHSSHGHENAVAAPTPKLILWWWFFSIIGTFLNYFILRMAIRSTFEDYTSIAILGILTIPIPIFILILRIKIVRTITEKQKRRPQITSHKDVRLDNQRTQIRSK